MSDKLNLLFDPEDSCRLDKYLGDLKIPELYSRTFIEKIISDKNIEVNGAIAKKSYLLQQGDTISITLPEPLPVDIVPQDIPLDIIFEDEYLAVINKPAGLVVHPGFGNSDNTLVNAIVFKYSETQLSGSQLNRPGIVHRLDQDTSGLIIIAKDDLTQSRLSDMFSQRKVKKTYLAITTGAPASREERIESFISRSLIHPRKMAVSETGRWSITTYKVLQYYHYFALLEVNLETGRTHQIRVHLTENKHPIVGDKLYNSIKNVQANVPDNMKKKVMDLLTTHLKRQALHAWKLEFEHPHTKVFHSFTAPIPADIIYTLEWLEQYFAIDNDRYDKKLLK